MRQRRNVAGALVDETGRRQLRVEAIAKDLGEPALVVVKAPFIDVVHSADVNDNVARVEDRGVARALQICGH